MKRLTTNVVLWLLSLFILSLALISFSESILTGVLFLIAAVLTNPIFLKILRKHHIRFKKVFYIPIVIFIWLLGIYAFPTSESNDSEQTQSESVEEVNTEIITDDAATSEEKDAVLASEIQDADSDIPASNTNSEPTTDSLSELIIHFIDVGQGDATLILCDGHAMLIDAGDNSKGTTLQLYLTKQGVEKLDYLVLTHPDTDHIGGADVIITKFDIDKIFMTDYIEDTKTYEEVLDALELKNKNWSMPSVGDTFTLGDAAFTVLAPLGTYSNSNDSSIALILVHGDNTFLFTGDCSENAEDDLVTDGQNLSADVYQVGHHGSRYSSSQALMDAVSPTYAVISCGENNSYGHPSAEALNRFRAMGIQVFRTDEQGSIIATSDGTEITWNCTPSETWKAGESGVSASAASQSNGTVVSNTQEPAAADNTQNTDSANAVPSTSDAILSGNSGSGTNPFETGSSPGAGLYIGNKNNGKLHRSTCHKLPKNENQAVFDTREAAVAAGYDDPCKLCKP